MKARRLVGLAFAGQVDAGLSSLATFGLQVYTARVFLPDELGAYALVFAAFVMLARVPAEITYKPIEVIAVDAPVEHRLSAIRSTVVPGLAVGALAAPVVMLGGFPAIGGIEAASWWALVGSAAVATVLSPLQDHLRRLFHIADRSWSAVQMAMVQTVAVIGGAVIVQSINPILVPFGSLAIANAVSIGWGLIAAWRSAMSSEIDISRVVRRDLARWLFAVGLTTSGLAYVTSAIISALLGLAPLGHIEAARVVARPIQVVAQGLVAVVGPRSMEAATARSWNEMRSWRGRYARMLAFVAVPYALITASDWFLNPMSRLVPVAYIVPGLVFGMLVAYSIQALNLPMESEILGFKAARQLASVALIAGVVEVVGSSTAPLLQEFTAPVWIAVAALTRRILYRRRIRNRLLTDTRSNLEE